MIEDLFKVIFNVQDLSFYHNYHIYFMKNLGVSIQKNNTSLTKDTIVQGIIVYNFPLDANDVWATKGKATFDVKILMVGKASILYFKEA